MLLGILLIANSAVLVLRSGIDICGYMSHAVEVISCLACNGFLYLVPCQIIRLRGVVSCRKDEMSSAYATAGFFIAAGRVILLFAAWMMVMGRWPLFLNHWCCSGHIAAESLGPCQSRTSQQQQPMQERALFA